MYTAVKGTYENGVLTLEETSATVEKSEVVVLFMNEEKRIAPENAARSVRIGSLADKAYQIPEE